jgi:GTPase SAR1 family protein
MASTSAGENTSLGAENSGKSKDKEDSVKVICLGDSAVGKSKYVILRFYFILV